MLLSLIVPCYNEEGNVTRFFDETDRVFRERMLDYEIIFIDDGSEDGTLGEIESLFENHPNVRGLSFSRNFGKEAAMLAGLKAAKGDLVCIIDADLQQRPEVVLHMLEEMENDHTLDCVAAYQKKRNEGKVISFFKSSFYKLINRMSDVRFVNGASDFRLMKRPMVEAIISLTEYHRFVKGIFGYVGFKTKFIPITHEKREIGKSKWGLWKLFKYAIHGIMAFTTVPLKLPMLAGIISVLIAAVGFIATLATDITALRNLSSGPAILLLTLFVGGIQLTCLGVLCEYVAKMYIETKKRPIYFVKQELEHGADAPKKPESIDKEITQKISESDLPLSAEAEKSIENTELIHK